MKIKVNGYICSNDAAPIYRRWGYEVACPEDIRQAVEKLDKDEELVVEVNSGGGQVMSGFEMYSLLRSLKCKTVAEVQSLAGSAASVIACGCQTVMMSPVAQMMIHDPAVATWGNIREHEESLQMLDSLKESTLNAYVDKCGGKCTREELSKLMRNETWIYPQDAVKYGLADGIMFENIEDPQERVNAVVNAAKTGISMAVAANGNLPSVEDLLKREAEGTKNSEEADSPDGAEDEGEEAQKTAENSEPAAEAAENTQEDGWALRRARVNLEKMRF